MAAKSDEPPRPSKADEVGAEHAQRIARDVDTDAIQQLKVLKGEFDSLRSHLTCKICDRLLYEPYSVACGHTYCYTVRKLLHIVHAKTAG